MQKREPEAVPEEPIPAHKYVIRQIIAFCEDKAPFTPAAWQVALPVLQALCDVLVGSIIPQDQDDQEGQGIAWVLAELDKLQRNTTIPVHFCDILSKAIKSLKKRIEKGVSEDVK